ncbi:unnamed protein product [Gemmata massiliana]|uniref:Uncharacterized protein n=1 Tax=Gemmata massiliana TaxID=1210884 RepID=A0A6P2CVW9_9BACT|nr:unnamed protein product [Gemmata massiliana]
MPRKAPVYIPFEPHPRDLPSEQLAAKGAMSSNSARTFYA